MLEAIDYYILVGALILLCVSLVVMFISPTPAPPEDVSKILIDEEILKEARK